MVYICPSRIIKCLTQTSQKPGNPSARQSGDLMLVPLLPTNRPTFATSRKNSSFTWHRMDMNTAWHMVTLTSKIAKTPSNFHGKRDLQCNFICLDLRKIINDMFFGIFPGWYLLDDFDLFFGDPDAKMFICIPRGHALRHRGFAAVPSFPNLLHAPGMSGMWSLGSLEGFLNSFFEHDITWWKVFFLRMRWIIGDYWLSRVKHDQQWLSKLHLELLTLTGGWFIFNDHQVSTHTH